MKIQTIFIYLNRFTFNCIIIYYGYFDYDYEYHHDYDNICTCDLYGACSKT